MIPVTSPYEPIPLYVAPKTCLPQPPLVMISDDYLAPTRDAMKSHTLGALRIVLRCSGCWVG